MKLADIASLLSCRLEGDGSIEINGIGTLETAREGEISFLTNKKYTQAARKTRASALIVDEDWPSIGLPLLRNRNPYLVFARVVDLFSEPREQRHAIHPMASVSPGAVIGRRVTVGAFTTVDEGAIIEDNATIGSNCTIYRGARIGRDTIIYSGCAIRETVSIGQRCIIHDNSVIGSDGFGYAKQDDGSWYKIRQTGTVVIEDDVEIGACSAIDRAALGETRISRGVKIDNLVHIGHGCTIDADSLICAQVGLAGSTRVGKSVILAGQVGAAGHLTIGDGTMVTAQSGLPSSVDAGKVVSGSPAVDHKTWLKSSAAVARLPELQKTIRDLERRLAEIEHRLM